jgi:hypothetical protein
VIPRLVYQPGQDLLEHLVRLRADDGIPVAENLHRHAHDTPRMSLGNLFFDQRSIRAGLNCALAPVRNGPLYGVDFQAQVPPLRQRVGKLLRAGQKVAHTTTAATCTKILEVEACLWAFVDHPTQASNWPITAPSVPFVGPLCGTDGVSASGVKPVAALWNAS